MALIITFLQLIINLFTAITNFIINVIQSIVILIWHNLFDIIIGFIRKVLFMLFRHSSMGYKTQEKFSSAKRVIKRKSRFDRNKIIRNT